MYQKCKCFFTYLMETPEVNSRFALLIASVVCGFSVLLLTIGFLFSHDKPEFPAMIMSVGGVVGVGATLGRAATKYVGKNGATVEINPTDKSANGGGDLEK